MPMLILLHLQCIWLLLLGIHSCIISHYASVICYGYDCLLSLGVVFADLIALLFAPVQVLPLNTDGLNWKSV